MTSGERNEVRESFERDEITVVHVLTDSVSEMNDVCQGVEYRTTESLSGSTDLCRFSTNIFPVPSPVLGLHHVTAIVADAQEDVDFSLDLLGLRLVKKTVDFDNPHGYHLFYGDELGRPGTLWTTRPQANSPLVPGVPGAGQVLATAFSVPRRSLPFWEDRLRAHDVPVAEGRPRFSDDVLVFRHPSGLVMELVGADDDPREPWASLIEPSSAIRGLHSVAIVVRAPDPTVSLLTRHLGGTVIDETEGRVRVALTSTAPGHLIDVLHDSRATPAVAGLGAVHHVAITVPTRDDQLSLHRKLSAAGLEVTGVYDRHYFASIAFREPGGVLVEIATEGPGFTVDEDPRTLGLDLKLPPWEEPYRQAITASLPPITTP